MEQPEVKRRIDYLRINLPYWHDEKGFLTHGDEFEKNHRLVERNRIVLVDAYRNAVLPILEKHIDQEQGGIVLEEGSGTGFFSRHIAPEWLKRRLMSFDVNPVAARSHKNLDPDSQVFLGSAYRIPVSEDITGTLIGFSSFDSLVNLPRAFRECLRVLRPGGKIILFQDLTIDLYEFNQILSAEERISRTENYHKLLIEDAEKAGLQVIEGRDEKLRGVSLERYDELKSRIEDLEIPESFTPFVINWNRGMYEPFVRSSTREAVGISKRDHFRFLERSLKKLRKNGYFEQFGAGPGDVVKMLTMRYLVLQKPE